MLGCPLRAGNSLKNLTPFVALHLCLQQASGKEEQDVFLEHMKGAKYCIYLLQLLPASVFTSRNTAVTTVTTGLRGSQFQQAPVGSHQTHLHKHKASARQWLT